MIKKLLSKSTYLKRVALRRAWRTRHPQWNEILERDRDTWNSALLSSNAGDGDEILIATSVGSHHFGTAVESLLAVALTLRGAKIHVFLCDGVLPACLACSHEVYPDHTEFVNVGPKRECRACFEPARQLFSSLGLTVHRYSDFVSTEERQWADAMAKEVRAGEIEGFRWHDLAVGEHAMAGALRFLARGTLEGEPLGEPILRRYFNAALVAAMAANNLVASRSFKTAVFHHGIYVPQGLVGEVCRKNNVHVVNWNPAYRKGCFIFSHHDTYHHTMMTEPVENWKSIEWSDENEGRLMAYLKSRWEGSQDWIWFHEKPMFQLREIAEETGIDFDKPLVGLLTSVMWDAVLHYPSNAFANMIEWIECTIGYFIRRPDVQLAIRIHPAEIRGTLPSRQRMADEIKKRFPVLPDNIIVIPPESHVSTYAVMMQCNSVIIYNTKTGVELSAVGVPVVVAGEAWIRNKGFCIEITNKQQYLEVLEKMPLVDRQYDTSDAKKYAYHFFFRRMLPVKQIRKGVDDVFSIGINTLQELIPGADQSVDLVCHGIMRGENFIIESVPEDVMP